MKTEDHAPSTQAQRDDPPEGRPSVGDYALLEELRFVRREAQAEADLAYQDWVVQPRGDGYTVYRAAQDRADAAQDQLADWATEIVGDISARLTLEAID